MKHRLNGIDADSVVSPQNGSSYTVTCHEMQGYKAAVHRTVIRAGLHTVQPFRNIPEWLEQLQLVPNICLL